jgi:hypothetical protein
MTTTLVLVWVRVVGAGAESVTSVRCEILATVDELKKLVKAEYSPKLDRIAAPDLVFKTAAGEVLEEDAVVANRREGRSKADAFIVEVPPASCHPFIISTQQGIFSFFIYPDDNLNLNFPYFRHVLI